MLRRCVLSCTPVVTVGQFLVVDTRDAFMNGFALHAVDSLARRAREIINIAVDFDPSNAVGRLAVVSVRVLCLGLHQRFAQEIHISLDRNQRTQLAVHNLSDTFVAIFRSERAWNNDFRRVLDVAAQARLAVLVEAVLEDDAVTRRDVPRADFAEEYFSVLDEFVIPVQVGEVEDVHTGQLFVADFALTADLS